MQQKLCLVLVGLLGMLVMVEGLRIPGAGGQPSAKRQTRAGCAAGEMPNNFAPSYLKYYGGPTLNKPCNIYLFYYGANFKNLSALQSNLQTFITNLAGSPWYSYTGALNTRNGLLTPTILFGAQIVQPTLKYGNIVDQATITKALLDQINTGAFPEDVDAQYYLLNGDDTQITANGQTVDYCGYHTYATSNAGNNIKIGFVVTDAKQLSVCTFANGGPYDDVSNSAITTIAHEIIETISDPEPGNGAPPAGFQTSLADSTGSYNENGDMCANIVFPTMQSTNGKAYTTYIGPNQYLMQANVNPATACCGYPTVSILGTASASVAASGAASAAATKSSAASIAASLPVGASPSTSPAAPSTSASAPPPSTSASAGTAGSVSNSPYGTYVYPSNAPTNTYVYYGNYCGDGYVTPPEQCDPGYLFFGGTSCCNEYCNWKNLGSQCASKRIGNSCFKTPRCERVSRTGIAEFCNEQHPKRHGTPCRVALSSGICDGHGTCNLVTHT